MVEQFGVGVEGGRGSIDMIALAATKPPLLKKLKPGETKRRRYRVDDRMTTEEIMQTVDDSSHLTFDYLANIVVGDIIAVGFGFQFGEVRVFVTATYLCIPRLLVFSPIVL